MKKTENLDQRAIRLHKDIYEWAVQYHRDHPKINYIDMQDAIYKQFGKAHITHSFDIMLIAKKATK